MHVLTVTGNCWSLKFRKIGKKRLFYHRVNIPFLSAHTQRVCKMKKAFLGDLQTFLNIFALLVWLLNCLPTTMGSVDTISFLKTIFEVNRKQRMRSKKDKKNHEQTEAECTTQLYMKAKVVLFLFFVFYTLLSLRSVLCRLQTETQALLGSSVTTSVTSQTSKTQPHAPSDTLTGPQHTSHINFSFMRATR